MKMNIEPGLPFNSSMLQEENHDVGNLAKQLSPDVTQLESKASIDLDKESKHMSTDISLDNRNDEVNVMQFESKASTDLDKESKHMSTDVSLDNQNDEADVAQSESKASTDLDKEIKHMSTDISLDNRNDEVDVMQLESKASTDLGKESKHMSTDISMDHRNDEGLPKQEQDEPISGNNNAFPIPNGVQQAVTSKCASAVDASQDVATVPLSDFMSLAEMHKQGEQQIAKRLKRGTLGFGKLDVNATIKQVADAVCVLGGLGLVRAGRQPTEIERKLFAEAYGRLGFLVQQVAPRELVSPDTVENLIAALGLRLSPEEANQTMAPLLVDSRPSLEAERVEQVREVADAANGGTMPHLASSQGQQIDSSLHGQMLQYKGSYFSGLPNNIPSANSMIAVQKDEKDQLQNKWPNVQLHEGHQVSHLTSNISLGQDNRSRALQKHAEFLTARLTQRQLTQAIQNLIHARPAECTVQPAHSRPFMNAAMPCEICKMVVKDTGTVLTCDSCEKLYHLRCLHSYLLKGIPKGDWYCPKCAMESGGQNQEPKYGRVKEGFSFTPRLATNVGGIHHSTESSAQVQPGLESSQKTVSLASTGVSKVELESGKRLVLDGAEAEKSSTAVVHPPGSFTALLGSFTQSEINQHSSKSELGPSMNQHSASTQAVQNSHICTDSRPTSSNSPVVQLQNLPSQIQEPKSGGQGARKVAGKNMETAGLQKVSPEFKSLPISGFSTYNHVPYTTMETAERVGESEQVDSQRSEKDADHLGVQWVGDSVQKYDGKKFYTACSVGGFVYRLQDCALFRPETPNVPPYIARLQALWEDTATGYKWVRVNWCYYPADMMMMAGRPANPEAYEVYESNHSDNNLVETIQGPCMVLRPEIYSKEIERRQDLLRNGHNGEGLVPIFMCRWLYDAPRTTFRPVNEGFMM